MDAENPRPTTDNYCPPYFAAAGNPAQFFTVSEGVTAECALEGASMFLATAASLGNNPEALDDGGRWAIVHLVEIAKALVDSVVDASMKRPLVSTTDTAPV